MAVFLCFRAGGSSLLVFQTEYYLIQLMYYDKKIIDVHNFSWRVVVGGRCSKRGPICCIGLL